MYVASPLRWVQWTLSSVPYFRLIVHPLSFLGLLLLFPLDVLFFFSHSYTHFPLAYVHTKRIALVPKALPARTTIEYGIDHVRQRQKEVLERLQFFDN